MLTIALRAIGFSLSVLPRRGLLFLGDLLGWGWYYLVPIRRSTVHQNLQLAFPSLNPRQIRKLAVDNFAHYGRCLLEILASLSWSKAKFREAVTIHGEAHLTSLIEEKKGFYLLNSHMGNWEILIGAGIAVGIDADVVVKKMNTASVNDFVTWNRKRMGIGLIAETQSAKDIFRTLSRGRAVAFIFDQFMGPPIGLPVTFFGKKAGTTVSLALLLEKRDVPVIPAYSYRDEKGGLHAVFEAPVSFEPLADDKTERLYQRTQKLNDVLEAIIRRHPSQWLWLHRRWKAYRGKPRWLMQHAATAVAFLAMLLSGCASKTEVKRKPDKLSYTGIELPKDPKIGIPKFVEVKEAEESKMKEPSVAKSRAMLLKNSKKKKAPAEKKAPKKAPQFKKYVIEDLPFQIGEQLKIALSWTALPAGSAVIEVRPGPKFNGRSTFQLWGNVRSNAVVSLIYRVNNTIESFIDTEGFVPYKFLLHMDEKDQKKETRVSFDHTKKKAFYWAKRISTKWGNLNEDRSDVLVPTSQDMFSALYYARTFEYQLGKTEVVRVYENGKNMEVQLLPVANELVTSKVGTFQCWKIRVRLKLNNIFKPMGDIHMWLSDDSRKYLVKFDAKVKVGVIRGRLVGVTDRAIAREGKK